MSFKGSTAVITGGAGGLGLSIAKCFLEEGATAVILDHTDESLNAAREYLRAWKNETILLKADIADPDSVARAFDAIDVKCPRIDSLVNCAGVREISSIYDLTPKQWLRVIGINLNGSYFCAREAALRMRKTDGGAIVNIASISGLTGVPNRPAYASSKHGVVGLTRSLATDLGADGIRVNAVAPGAIRTPMTEHYYHDAGFLEGLRSTVPLSVDGTPRDIAQAVLFLCSIQSRFINGVVLPVDGGWSAGKSYAGKNCRAFNESPRQS